MAEILHYTKPYELRRVSGSVVEPITLSVAKNYLRIDYADDDALIAEMLVSARHFAENYMGIALAAQNFSASYYDELPSFIILPMHPINAITSIVSHDSSGNQTTLASNLYRLSSERYLHFNGYYASNLTVINYSTLSIIGEQAALKRAMLAHVALMYDMRGEAPMPTESINIYNQYKQVRL